MSMFSDTGAAVRTVPSWRAAGTSTRTATLGRGTRSVMRTPVVALVAAGPGSPGASRTVTVQARAGDAARVGGIFQLQVETRVQPGVTIVGVNVPVLPGSGAAETMSVKSKAGWSSWAASTVQARIIGATLRASAGAMGDIEAITSRPLERFPMRTVTAAGV